MASGQRKTARAASLETNTGAMGALIPELLMPHRRSHARDEVAQICDSCFAWRELTRPRLAPYCSADERACLFTLRSANSRKYAEPRMGRVVRLCHRYDPELRSDHRPHDPGAAEADLRRVRLGTRDAFGRAV